MGTDEYGVVAKTAPEALGLIESQAFREIGQEIGKAIELDGALADEAIARALKAAFRAGRCAGRVDGLEAMGKTEGFSLQPTYGDLRHEYLLRSCVLDEYDLDFYGYDATAIEAAVGLAGFLETAEGRFWELTESDTLGDAIEDALFELEVDPESVRKTSTKGPEDYSKTAAQAPESRLAAYKAGEAHKDEGEI